MKNNLSNDAVLKELGDRLQRLRLNNNMTQVAQAREAGISERTIIRIEHGESTQLANFISLLRSLGLLENIDAWLPQSPISPIQQLKLQRGMRKRASSPKAEKAGEAWAWGDGE